MIREEEYAALMKRLLDPQNYELRQKMTSASGKHSLEFHLKRIDEYINHFEEANSISKQLLESDYSTSLRHAKQLMDEQGWK